MAEVDGNTPRAPERVAIQEQRHTNLARRFYDQERRPPRLRVTAVAVFRDALCGHIGREPPCLARPHRQIAAGSRQAAAQDFAYVSVATALNRRRDSLVGSELERQCHASCSKLRAIGYWQRTHCLGHHCGKLLRDR
jgi:hypothetical protein